MQNPMNSLLRQSRPQNLMQNRNPVAMMTEFRKFAQGMTPEGARQRVEQLLASGKMSQEQFEQLKEQAQQFSQFLK